MNPPLLTQDEKSTDWYESCFISAHEYCIDRTVDTAARELGDERDGQWIESVNGTEGAFIAGGISISHHRSSLAYRIKIGRT